MDTILDFCLEVELLQITNVTSHNLSSPLYPELYPNQMNCVWKINTEEDNFILINFLNVELDLNDEVLIGLGTAINQNTIMIIEAMMGYPNTLTANATQIWIVFVSNTEGRAKGFLMEIQMADRLSKLMLIWWNNCFCFVIINITFLECNA